MSTESSRSFYKACGEGSVEDIVELIAAGAEPNIIAGSNGCTPIHHACEQRSSDGVRCLLDHGADVNSQTYKGTPLHIACRQSRSCLSIVQSLVQHGASLNIADTLKFTPLHLACKRNNADIVEYLIRQGADIHDVCRGRTLLEVACTTPCWEVVWTLIKLGADVHAVFAYGVTPLHSASQGNCEELVSYLIDKGVDVNARTKYGTTPLYLAAMHGSPKLVQCLLNYGAEVNAVSKNGYTPLHMACQNDSCDNAVIMMQNGANINAVDRKGRNPLHVACGHRTPQQVTCADRPLKTVECLLENGADLHAVDYRGMTPLHEACVCSWLDIVRSLLKYGACVHVKENRGNTPLHLALESTWYTKVEVICCLLESGADPGAVSNSRLTPFQTITNEIPSWPTVTLFGIWAGISSAADIETTVKDILVDAGSGDILRAEIDLRYTQILFANMPFLPLNHRDVLTAHIHSLPAATGVNHNNVIDLLSQWLDTYINAFPSLKAMCRATVRNHLGFFLVPRIRPFFRSYPRLLVEYLYLYHDARVVFSDNVGVIDELFKGDSSEGENEMEEEEVSGENASHLLTV